ncbi:hypothetical protein [Bacillus cereus]|uniref:hypothetical protein n=1 Tax=Bacillus cereus TaxID=1396 RepID=UPI0015CF5292|nr:hypothetical protein [Bacillus cereus]
MSREWSEQDRLEIEAEQEIIVQAEFEKLMEENPLFEQENIGVLRPFHKTNNIFKKRST